MNFNISQKGRKNLRNQSPIKLLESPAIKPSGLSTIFLSSDIDELCVRSKFLLQEEQTGNISEIIYEEIIAIVDKFLENRCISEKQHKQKFDEYNLSHKGL